MKNTKLIILLFLIFPLALFSKQVPSKESNPLLEQPKNKQDSLFILKEKDAYSKYKEEAYSKPPQVNKRANTSEKDFDFDFGVGVDKEQKKLDEIKLDLGKKF